MKKAKKSSVNPDAWLATYGDMVTLLLCFFVLLYSMSSIDSAKWEMIVKSFNPKADKVSQIVVGDPTPGDDDVGASGSEGIAPLDTLEQLYNELKEFVESNELTEDVDMFKGDGYIFITFRNKIFFDGDSAVLRAENEPILDYLAQGIGKIRDDVSEVKVFGHTNQANPNAPNEVVGDRALSSLRASNVVAYMQKQDCLDPKKMSGVGYGQWYSVAPYDTEENRQQNRRVEILIAKTDTVQLTLDEIYKEMEQTIY